MTDDESLSDAELFEVVRMQCRLEGLAVGDCLARFSHLWGMREARRECAHRGIHRDDHDYAVYRLDTYYSLAKQGFELGVRLLRAQQARDKENV